MTSTLATAKIKEVKEIPYEIVSLLGQGATGKVYRCRHLLTGHHYAIKTTHAPACAVAAVVGVDGQGHIHAQASIARGSVMPGQTHNLDPLTPLDPPAPLVHIPHANNTPRANGNVSSSESARGEAEVGVLARLQLSIHVIRLHDAFVYEGRVYMVYELMDNTPFLHEMPLGTRAMMIPFYLRQMLKGLSHIHKHHIIHFDIKPGNLVRDRRRQLLKWIDFANSVQYVPGDENSPDVGTVSYRAPEMLFKSTKLTYAVDVWAVGCIFLQMLYPAHAWKFFSAVHNVAEQIDHVCNKFGADAVHDFCTRYDLTCFKFAEGVSRTGVSWPTLLGVDGEYFEEYGDDAVTTLALDLLDKLLSLDPVHRPTAEEALNHPYFSSR